MTIPFFDFLKGRLSKGQAVMAEPMAPPLMEKPNSERLSKTVLPNAARTISPPAPSFRTSPTPTPTPTPTPAPAMAAAPAPAAGAAPVKRPFSLGAAPAGSPRPAIPRPSDLPPAVALALEPKVERVIAIELSEVASRIPPDWIRPVSEAEKERRVLLKAVEVERGMSTGKPSISLGSIYQQLPEIFLRPVPADDSTQVPLPFAKVLEEFKNVQQRGDQFREQAVPQVETPFLKVTLEDNSKFGTITEPLEMGELPPVRLVPATAQAIADAHPEVTAQDRFVPPSPPPVVEPITIEDEIEPAVLPPPARTMPAAPTRIPFKLSPTGPDAPASERVPASSGPSVPSGSPPVPERIPFKLAASNDESPAKPDSSWLTKENFDPQAQTPMQVIPPPAVEAEVPKVVKISLPLRPILQGLPPFQLTGDANAVPEDDRLEVPFSLVEPQLALGRVSLTTDQFAAALSEKHKGLFSAKEIAAPVLLPLQDVLKNLPRASLRMRDDQVEQEQGEQFATPFSARAEEDAKRFNLNVGPPKPLQATVKPLVTKAAEIAPHYAPTASPVAPALKMEKTAASRNALQTALDTDDELDAKAVVAHLGKIAGIKACAIMFGDGLSLAGNLPEEYQADGLCAMAPSLLEKIGGHIAESKLGPLRALTLSCAQASVSFFMHDNLCLAALHSKEELAAAVRERLAGVVHELSRKYSNPA